MVNNDDDDDDLPEAVETVESIQKFSKTSKSQSSEEVDLVNRNAEYQIRPPLADKFKSLSVREVIHAILNEVLGGKTYSPEESELWIKNIVSSVKESVKELGFKRYKLIVQTILGQNKGCGVKIGARCLWDADTDNYASESYLSETLFCCVIVFGIYCY